MSRPIHHLIVGMSCAGPGPAFTSPKMIDLNRASIVYTSRSARSVVARARRILKAVGPARQPLCAWVATSTKDLVDAHVGQAFGVDIEVFRAQAAAADTLAAPAWSVEAKSGVIPARAR